MAKRDSSDKQTQTQTQSETAELSDAVEQRLVAFAEQIGRIAGTVSAKAEGLVDREALKQQIAGVRDSASELLEHLSDGVTSIASRAKKTVGEASKKATSAAKAVKTVDLIHAPGKKHRKPMPKDPRAIAADAKRAAMRAGKASMKTTKTRGRG
jgi:uncharacterized phage infection (PIP) family protein YhgE